MKGGKNMLNIPQENRKLSIVKDLKDINNIIDNVNLQVVIEQLEKAESTEYVSSYVVFALQIIDTHNDISINVSEIKKNLQEIKEYSSLFAAIKSGNKNAQKYFEKSAEDGAVIRIV